jgi:hypothetical protein
MNKEGKGRKISKSEYLLKFVPSRPAQGKGRRE